jgi:hypothetical protein
MRVALGVLVGWMILVRPVSAILLAAIGLHWWITSRAFVPSALGVSVVLGVAAIVVSSWTVRNYVEFDEPIAIATNGGYNFWQTNHRYADGNDTFWPFVPMDDPEYITMRDGDEFTKNREGYRYALAFLREHPWHIVTMLPTKLFWLYHSDTSGFYEGVLYPPLETPSPVADWIRQHEQIVESGTFRYYELLMAIAAAGALTALLSRQTWAISLLSLPLLLTGFHLFFHAKDRFHIPLAGVLAIFAAFFVLRVASWARLRLR